MILPEVDLPKNQQKRFGKRIQILKNIDGIAHIELDEEDVVRHRLVKTIIKSHDRDHKQEQERHG